MTSIEFQTDNLIEIIKILFICVTYLLFTFRKYKLYKIQNVGSIFDSVVACFCILHLCLKCFVESQFFSHLHLRSSI